jgi:hypothetical protein
LYQVGDGDWGWYERNIGHNGREFDKLPVAAVTNTWYLSGFSISKEHGIAVLAEPLVVSTRQITSASRRNDLK